MAKQAGCGCGDEPGRAVAQQSRLGRVSSAIEPAEWGQRAIVPEARDPLVPRTGARFGTVSSAIEAAAIQAQAPTAGSAVNVGLDAGNNLRIADAPKVDMNGLDLDDITPCGGDVGGFGTTDSVIHSFMRSRKIPHVALAVISGDGRLVYAKGFSNTTVQRYYARETGFVACPRSQFRIASVSKLFTAVGIMKLVEDTSSGLTLSTTLADLGLDDLYNSGLAANIAATSTYSIPATQERWSAVTVQGLLTHTSGICERSSGPTPTFIGSGVPNMMTCNPHAWYKLDKTVQGYFGKEIPATRDNVLVCLGSSAMNLPNLWWSYANDGYILLGRIIEAVTGRDYESWIRENVLCPVGAYATVLGEGDRFTRVEAPYYTEAWPWEMVGNMSAADALNPGAIEASFSASVMDANTRYQVYSPRGTRNIRLAEGGGGWISSVYDLARFARNLFALPDGGSEPRVLSSSTVSQMCQSYVNLQASHSYSQGLGFKVAWYGSADRGHTGHWDGTHARLYHVGTLQGGGGTSTAGAYAYAILLNRYWDTFDNATPTESTLHSNLRTAIAATMAAGTRDDLWDSV